MVISLKKMFRYVFEIWLNVSKQKFKNMFTENVNYIFGKCLTCIKNISGVYTKCIMCMKESTHQKNIF